MSRCFGRMDTLLPEKDFDKWSVIACDQHTSDPAYWQQIRQSIGTCPSSLNLILPEAELNQLSDSLIERICRNMDTYIADGTLRTYPGSFVYLERVLMDGSVRQGIVGIVDLERYDIDPKPDTKVFATEGTVAERLPPRIRIRKDAPMELSHCVIFCDDKEKRLVEAVGHKKNVMQKLYGLDLMCGGGRIDGWLVDGQIAEDFEKAVDEYEKDHIYLVGDGNHSLLTAKRCFEEIKKNSPREVWENSPARFAMVELENIHSPAMVFEPIYRVITDTDPYTLMNDLRKMEDPDGTQITLITAQGQSKINLPVGDNELTVGVVQAFLDQWLKSHEGELDYIHGKDVVCSLAQMPNAVGILLPDIDKGMLFPYIHSGKITPRKTFSIGHASEKRYYMEGRRIL